MEVTKTRDKLFVFKGNCYCFDFLSQRWTELICPVMGQLYPVCCNRNSYMYLFPKDERWTFYQILEEQLLQTKLQTVWRKSTEDGEAFESLTVSEKFNINSTNIVGSGKKFFYIQKNDDTHSFQLVSGFFEDLKKFYEIGISDQSVTELTNLVILPYYPGLKCTSTSVEKSKASQL